MKKQMDFRVYCDLCGEVIYPDRKPVTMTLKRKTFVRTYVFCKWECLMKWVDIFLLTVKEFSSPKKE